MAFPLYDDLLELVSDHKELKPKQVQVLMQTINRLKDEDLNKIYLLIVHHYIINSTAEVINSMFKKNTIPYGGKFLEGKRGANFDAQKIPPKLLVILNMFVFQEFEFEEQVVED